MKKLILPLTLLFFSCSNITYEVLYKVKTSSSASTKIEAVLSDGSTQSILSSTAADHTIVSQLLPISKDSALDDESFKEICPTPSEVIREINIYSVSTSSDTTTETLQQTIPVNDAEWTYRRWARNLGIYLYELE